MRVQVNASWAPMSQPAKTIRFLEEVGPAWYDSAVASSEPDKSGADALKLEIDGPGVHPQTVDPLLTLDLGRAYLRFLNKIADEAELDLEFKGLDIEDKCAALVFPSGKIAVAERVATDAHRMLAGSQLVSRRVEASANEFRAALRALPAGQSVAVLLRKTRLPIPAQPSVRLQPLRSVTKLRAMLIAVGGKQPTAKFTSKSEGTRPFTVRLSDIPTAQRLGALLFKEMDVEVRVERDPDGLIIAGELLDFMALTGTDPLESWRAWFKAAASEWDSIDDIDKELGRDEVVEAWVPDA
jgi:hypothetical protein